METGSAQGPEPGAGSVPAPPPAVARQRWRLVLACGPDALGRSGRDLTEMWETALESSGLPAFRPVGRDRARVAFGAPLPAEIAADAELADIFLTTLEPAWRVREALADRVPAGWRLLDVHDIWLGAPALAGQVVAADYRIDLGAADAGAIGTAAASLLAAQRLPRERPKGGTTVPYDLRPLLADVRVVDAGPPVLVVTRTRFLPDLGTGRPAEVVAALGAAMGVTLVTGPIVRERLILAGDLVGGP